MRLTLIFAALLAASPAFAGEHVVRDGARAGYSVSGPNRLSTACHVRYYRLDGDRRLYRRVHCPGAPKLNSVGMPADGCFNRAVCARASRNARIIYRNGQKMIQLY